MPLASSCVGIPIILDSLIFSYLGSLTLASVLAIGGDRDTTSLVDLDEAFSLEGQELFLRRGGSDGPLVPLLAVGWLDASKDGKDLDLAWSQVGLDGKKRGNVQGIHIEGGEDLITLVTLDDRSTQGDVVFSGVEVSLLSLEGVGPSP